MLKKIITLGIFLISFVGFANVFAGCPKAAPPSNPAFCKSFKKSAECHCVRTGLPKTVCTNMQQIYLRMLGLFGTVERACAFQHDTSVQECLDSWTCYRLGGRDANGNLCSGTGASC